MKSKAQILVEKIDKIFEENGLPKPKYVKREGSFVYIPPQKQQKKENK
jgi:predicted HTH transcriptional regulator